MIFKRLVYKYLGLYLAHKEENDYITSKEFWKKFNKNLTHKSNDFSPHNLQGLMIGMWQADKGFTRPMSKWALKRPHWFYNPIAWCDELYTTIKWDVQNLYRKLFK